MTGAPGSGRRIGATTGALDVLGLAAATALLAGISPIGAVGVLGLVAVHLILGWRTHDPARAARPPVSADT